MDFVKLSNPSLSLNLVWRVDITTVGLISARNDTNNEENDVSIVLPNGRTCSPTSIPKMRFSLLGAVDYHQGKLIHCGGAGPSWTYISGQYYLTF